MVGSGDLKQDYHYSKLVMAESQARSRTDSGTHKTVYRALQEQIFPQSAVNISLLDKAYLETGFILWFEKEHVLVLGGWARALRVTDHGAVLSTTVMFEISLILQFTWI